MPYLFYDRDAKIAALEKTSQESEKLIAQARTEKLKQMDELYAANRKCAELESRYVLFIVLKDTSDNSCFIVYIVYKL